jgi:hypothetical protein
MYLGKSHSFWGRLEMEQRWNWWSTWSWEGDYLFIHIYKAKYSNCSHHYISVSCINLSLCTNLISRVSGILVCSIPLILYNLVEKYCSDLLVVAQ